MENLFVPYELAMELKGLGYNECGFGMYHTKDGLIRKISPDEYGDAPLFQQAFEWFRINHKIYTAILPYRDENISLSWYYSIVEDEEQDILCNEIDLGATEDFYETYQECELECLKKLIEIAKQ